MQLIWRKHITAIGPRQVLISIVVAMSIATSLSGWLDRPAQSFYSESIKQVFITFALARTVNAVISVAQDTDVNVHPVGIGMTIGVGEILDPVNDMVERFSWVMVLSATSLGVQRVLLEVSKWGPITVALLVLGTLYLISFWLKKGKAIEPWMQRLFLLFLFLRLSVPLILSLNSLMHGAFLKTEYEEAQLVLEQADQEIRPFQDTQQELAQHDERRLLGRLRNRLEDVKSAGVDMTKKLAQWAKQIYENLIRLIVVFLMQTIVFPIAFLCLLLWLIRHAFGRPSSQ